VNSAATKRLCEFISGLRKHQEESIWFKLFGYLVNAFRDDQWDQHAANFIFDAIKESVPAGLVRGRLMNSENPTVPLSDALRASELAFASKYSLGIPHVGIWQKVKDLANAGLLESDFGKSDGTDEDKLVRMDSWLEIILTQWRYQLITCRRETTGLIEAQQRLRPDDAGILSIVRFTSMMREMVDNIEDVEILQIYKEVADMTGRHQDKLASNCFFEVCRNHCISYIGPA